MIEQVIFIIYATFNHVNIEILCINCDPIFPTSVNYVYKCSLIYHCMYMHIFDLC